MSYTTTKVISREEVQVLMILDKYNREIYSFDRKTITKEDSKRIKEFCNYLRKEADRLEEMKQNTTNKFYYIERQLDRIS